MENVTEFSNFRFLSESIFSGNRKFPVLKRFDVDAEPHCRLSSSRNAFAKSEIDLEGFS